MNELIRPQFHDAEISKATDFGGTSEFPVELINILFDGIYREVPSNFVLGGLDVLEVTPVSMNVKVVPGVAYDRASKKILVLSNDLIVSVPSCDPNLDRIDTLEIKYIEVDADVEMRTFKDPANGTIATQSIPTKKKITVQGKCLAGVPGSGVAPNTEEGWVKLAEVNVLAGTGSITGDDIREIDSEYSTVANNGWTAQVSSTFRVGSPYWIKRIARLHENTLITNASMAHGIRQGRGNGFDTDKVRGVTPTDNGLHLLSIAQYDLGWDSMLSVTPKVYTSKITWLDDWPYMNHDQTFYEGIPYRSLHDDNVGQLPPDNLGTHWEVVGGGSGTGNVGYEFTAGQMESGVAGWTGYKDAAQTTPVDGTGGTVSTGHTFAQNTVDPIIGTADALWSKPASDCQGEGWSAPLYIDEGVRGEPAQVSLNFKTPATGYADGDAGVYIEDVTNGVVIPGSIEQIPNTIGRAGQMVISFIPSASRNYRICLHVRSTSSTPWAMRIANVQVGPLVGAQASSPGGWKDFVPNTGIYNLPGSWSVARYRKNGDSIDLVLSYQVSGAATGSLRLYGDEVLSSLGLTVTVESLSIPGAVCNDASASAYYVGMWNPNNGSGGFRGPTGGGWNATVPFTWASGDTINIVISLPVSQWAGSGIGTVQNYVEYASNSDVTATASVTGSGFLQGFGNFGGFGSGWAVGTTWVRRVKFQQPIQWGMDEILIGLTLPTNGSIWDHAEYSSYMIAASAFGDRTIGFKVDPVAGDPYSADVSFLADGRKSTGAYGSVGSPWSGLTGFKWFAKKTSAGKPGETLPLIRAEYTSTSTIVPSTTQAIVPLTTKVEDTHSCVSANAFTAPVSGVYQVEATLGGNVATTTTAYVTLPITKNGSNALNLSVASVPPNARLVGSGTKTMRLNAGDVIAVTIYAENNTNGNFNSHRVAITLIGR